MRDLGWISRAGQCDRSMIRDGLLVVYPSGACAMSDKEPEIAIDDNVMVVTDLYGSLVSVSGAVEEVFGYSESELVGQSVEMLVPEGLRARHRDHMGRYSRRPHARTMGIGMELNAAHANGSEFPIEVSLRVISG